MSFTAWAVLACIPLWVGAVWLRRRRIAREKVAQRKPQYSSGTEILARQRESLTRLELERLAIHQARLNAEYLRNLESWFDENYPDHTLAKLREGM